MRRDKPPLLLLWDIDGTLIASGGAGMRALTTALQSVFGISGSLADIDFAGRTDRWIMRQIFAKYGLPASEENFQIYCDGYFQTLPQELAAREAHILPGVREILEQAASRGHVTQGLLTGNMEVGARTKLSYHGLWRYFSFGAFANDSELRNELGPHAIQRAERMRGYAFTKERTWVIGDTPHDIACGKAIHARTLAVATGHSTPEILLTHQPDALLKDLSDADAFWRSVDPE